MRHFPLKWNWVVLCTVSFSVLLFIACKKHFKADVQAGDDIQIVAKPYMEKLVKSEESLLALPYSELRKSSNIRIFSRLQKLNKNLNWSNAASFSKNGISYMVVPIDDAIKPFKNAQFEGCRSIVFYKTKSNRIDLYIVEAISKEGNEFGGKQIDIAKSAFEKKTFGETLAPGNLNVSVILYNRFYYSQASYQLSNGSIQVGNLSLKNQLHANDKSKVAVNSISHRLNVIGLTSCTTCTTWNLVAYWYDTSTGDIIDAITLDTWNECVTTGGGYGDGPGGSGGSQSTNAIALNNTLTDPCLSGVMTSMTPSMNNILHDLMGDYGPNRYNITFQSRGAYSNPDQYADTDQMSFNWSTNTWDITTSMYDGYFTGVTKEFMGSAMIHEILHAALQANGVAYDNFIQHTEIAEHYREIIETGLINNFGISQDDAAALSWMGLGETKLWKDMDPTLQIPIVNKVNAYKSTTSTVGSRC